MYVDFWILLIFALLYGVMAVWNRKEGFRDGCNSTIDQLIDDGLITEDDLERVMRKKGIYVGD